MKNKTFPRKTLPKGFLLVVLFTVCYFPVSNAQASQTAEILKKKQHEFLSWKFGMFLHFNMATYYNEEWANGYEDPTGFNPSKLDCGQWADVAKAAGMKYGILTVKHTGGWCLWDSKYTTHDITGFKNFRNGNGDIVREYVDAFRSRGLNVGLYYCLPGDYANIWGNKLDAGKNDMHGMVPEATGDYEWYIEKQVEELLTMYGKIDLFWFDQYANPYTGKYWKQLKALVHKLQPECIVIANNSHSFDETDIVGFEYPYLKSAKPGEELPKAGNSSPAEVCDCIDDKGWFWHPGTEKMRSGEEIAGLVKLCNERNANYLLDVPPDTSGLIPETYVIKLKEIGAKQK
jgi:alpha-L-fucosidase